MIMLRRQPTGHIACTASEVVLHVGAVNKLRVRQSSNSVLTKGNECCHTPIRGKFRKVTKTRSLVHEHDVGM